ncbi:hypothetical protein [Nocardia salmonicida]|uniref:hypothetical protein n=1 Tax=Nocardia salmonicida TaxID=53431 RepID=UPI0007A4126A|nr:hypothetical protein [Nocardia salmonicida]MBC7299548.1 DUF4254 domain-containing protein [Nocardia sp.]
MSADHSAGVLPDWHELHIAAVGGGAALEHPLTRLARALAKLHRKRWPSRKQAVAARRRRVLVDAIDLWVAANVGVAVAETASVGALIDELTRAGACARRLLATTDPAGDAVHAAWTAVAVLADEWSDLVTHTPIHYERFNAGTR